MSVVDDEPRPTAAPDMASMLVGEMETWLYAGLYDDEDFVTVARRVQGEAFAFKHAMVHNRDRRRTWVVDGGWFTVSDKDTGVGPIIDPFAGIVALKAPRNIVMDFVEPANQRSYNDSKRGSAALEALRDGLSPSPTGIRVVPNAPVYLLLPVYTVAKIRAAGATAVLPQRVFKAINRGYRALRDATGGIAPEENNSVRPHPYTVVVALPAE